MAAGSRAYFCGSTGSSVFVTDAEMQSVFVA